MLRVSLIGNLGSGAEMHDSARLEDGYVPRGCRPAADGSGW
jgi:hypothetical protein